MRLLSKVYLYLLITSIKTSEQSLLLPLCVAVVQVVYLKMFSVIFASREPHQSFKRTRPAPIPTAAVRHVNAASGLEYPPVLLSLQSITTRDQVVSV